MTDFRFTDTAALSGIRKIEDGYLVTEAFAVRTGIQLYTGGEMGLVDRDVVRVYRPEDEVRAPESLQTFSHAPITVGHPERVTADNWKNLAKGEVSTEAEWKDGKIRLPLIIKDAEAIQIVEGGTRELSAGYTCQIEFADGITPDGEPYDAIQRNIRVNHLAIVPKGRAGEECRIGDGAQTWGPTPLNSLDTMKGISMSNQTVNAVLGDKAVQVSAADAAVIEAFKADASKALADAKAAHKAALDAKDRELAAKDAEIGDLKSKIVSDADLDARVEARSKLVADAAKVDANVKAAGLSDADLRKVVVTAKKGADFVDGRSDAYLEATFDHLVEAADAKSSDQFADASKKGIQTENTDLNQVYADRAADLSRAWQSGQKGD